MWQPFLDGFVEAAQRYRLGDPLDPETSLGPMASAPARPGCARRSRRRWRRARRTHVEPQLFRADSGGIAYLMPQVLTGVDHGMAVMREETFGPVVGIMKVADDDEAVRLMNDSDYGLTASIWTADLDAAERLAPQIEAGTVFANRCDYLDPLLAWTGVKQSGRGASLGRYGFESVTRPRSLHLRSARMTLPHANWNYPTAIRFGAGRIAELPAACRELGLERPLLVTDPALAELPMVREALARNEAAGCHRPVLEPSPQSGRRRHRARPRRLCRRRP